MKTLSSLLALISAAAIALAPLSIELSSSLFVAAGVLSLLSREYAQPRLRVGRLA